MDEAIRELAREAGIANDWIDAAGAPRRVAIDPLRSILAALGLPATSKADVAQSRARLREATSAARTFVTATVGKPIALAAPSTDKDTPAELSLETGETKAITLRANQAGAVVPPVRTPGYHRLRITIDWCSSNTLEFQAQPGCDLSLDVSPDPTVPLFWALTFGRRSWLQLTPAGLGT